MLSKLGKAQKKQFIYGAFIKLPTGCIIAVCLLIAFNKYFNNKLAVDEIIEIILWLIFPCTFLVICFYANLLHETKDTNQKL